MTALTATSTARAHRDEGYLSAGISASATTVYVGAIYKYPDGVKTKQGFDTTSGFAEISRGGKYELISFGAASVNSTTKVTTLTDVRRGLSQTSTTPTFTAGTGRKWNKGARIAVTWTANDVQSAAYKDVANTFTAPQTFSGLVTSTAAITMSGTTSYLKVPNLTTTQRNALTASNGMIVYDSTLGVLYQYIGGAWSTFATGSVVNAADTVAGKVDIATGAEIGAGTATDATSGALNVIPVSQTAKTSSGAGDENKLIVLGASGTAAVGFLGTGTPSAATYLAGDGAWTTLQGAITETEVFGDGSDGALNVTSGTTSIDAAGANVVVKQYTSINVSSGATLNVTNPAASGTILILKSQGDVTFAGTVDLRNCGSTGGTAVTSTKTGTTGDDEDNGNAGTAVFNAFGQTRQGGAGNGATPTIHADGSGGGGGANFDAGTAAATAGTVGGGAAGAAITTTVTALACGGIIIAPGAGGGSGGTAVHLEAYTSGDFSGTSGAGGRGAGSLVIYCGGNYNDNGGTLNLSGTVGGNASKATGTSTQYAIAAGGGGGGAGGICVALVKGTITQTGTHTLTAGGGGTHDDASVGGSTGTGSNGGAGATGLFLALNIALGY